MWGGGVGLMGGCRVGGEGRGSRGGGAGGEGGQGGCERRIEVFGEIHKKKIRVGGGVGLGRGGVRMDVIEELKFGGRGRGGCERRIEVFVKIQKKKNGGEGGVLGGSGWM